MAPTDCSTGLEFWVSLAARPQGGSLVTVMGELDVATAPRLRATLEQALAAEGDVEIDLRGCGFVDSSGIATLVWVAIRLKDRNRRLLLLGARERVRRILDLAGIAGHKAVEIVEPPSVD
ncbi:MAG: anti-sigma factor antagonist [Solirubrobacterales bacterium]|nr:anti-sigma factor antagonist [Solirubrobacterales bacterium]